MIEINSEKFLDTMISINDGTVTTHTMTSYKCQTSKIPKQYKQNKILGHLHCVKIFATNFKDELGVRKFKKAEYLKRLVESIIKNSENTESFIIPFNMFEEEKVFILLEVHYCE